MGPVGGVCPATLFKACRKDMLGARDRVLLIPCGKTDGEGQGALAYPSPATMVAIARWRGSALMERGPPFRPPFSGRTSVIVIPVSTLANRTSVVSIPVRMSRSIRSVNHIKAQCEFPRLLMRHDRFDADEIRLTHDFIGMIIAPERSGVTVGLHLLESAGMIQSRRGRVIILDRGKPEGLAGDRYGVPEVERRHRMGPRPVTGDSIADAQRTLRSTMRYRR
ncbi:MAG: hypothetical protein ABW182_01140 [Sphingomonas sp.]